MSNRCARALVVLFVAGFASRALIAAPKAMRYAMRGLVLRVDRAHSSMLVSHDSVPDVMSAMAMSFDVVDRKELDGVEPGAIVEFTLVVNSAAARAEHVRVQRYESAEQDPLTARRLRLLARPRASLDAGQPVPDFTLVDQARRSVTLSQLRGRVIALNFIYTSCALPQFCFRTANVFGAIQRRFKARMGRDLVLLTATFDPARDQPERLADYAGQWHADSASWHFLTGTAADVRRLCETFGIESYPDEGLLVHSLHTAVIDRDGRLVANIEGNQFTAGQLGDLIDDVLRRPRPPANR